MFLVVFVEGGMSGILSFLYVFFFECILGVEFDIFGFSGFDE